MGILASRVREVTVFSHEHQSFCVAQKGLEMVAKPIVSAMAPGLRRYKSHRVRDESANSKRSDMICVTALYAAGFPSFKRG